MRKRHKVWPALDTTNDIGVFRSLDAGKSWKNITGAIPNASVTDLVYHEASNTLTAATYGRGLWRATL